MFNETKTHEITVDVVILTIINNAIRVLLVKRLNEQDVLAPKKKKNIFKKIFNKG